MVEMCPAWTPVLFRVCFTFHASRLTLYRDKHLTRSLSTWG